MLSFESYKISSVCMYVCIGTNNKSESSIPGDIASSRGVGSSNGDSPPAIHTSSVKDGHNSQPIPLRKRRNDEVPVFETMREVRMTRADMVSSLMCMYVCMLWPYVCVLLQIHRLSSRLNSSPGNGNTYKVPIILFANICTYEFTINGIHVCMYVCRGLFEAGMEISLISLMVIASQISLPRMQ